MRLSSWRRSRRRIWRRQFQLILHFSFSGLKTERGQAIAIQVRNINWDCLLQIRRRDNPQDAAAAEEGRSAAVNTPLLPPSSNPNNVTMINTANAAGAAIEANTESADDEGQASPIPGTCWMS